MIVNNPIGRDNILNAWAYWDGAFTDVELQKIVQLCEEAELEKAETFDPTATDNYRVSSVNFHRPDEKNKWIFERLNGVADLVNDNFFGFDLAGYEFFQYSTYEGDKAGRYDWHVDCLTGSVDQRNGGLHRKLSMTLLLDDGFEGGDFEINLGKSEKVDVLKGRAIFFPAFVPHRVTPVTVGIRRSLVIWLLGKKFR